jgi:hypothetical protein
LPLGPPGLSGSRLNFGMRFASVVPTHVTVRHGVATASQPHPHCVSPHADCEWERGPLWYGCMHGGCSRTACPIGGRAGGERRTGGRQRVASCWCRRAVLQSKKKTALRRGLVGVSRVALWVSETVSISSAIQAPATMVKRERWSESPVLGPIGKCGVGWLGGWRLGTG